MLCTPAAGQGTEGEGKVSGTCTWEADKASPETLTDETEPELNILGGLLPDMKGSECDRFYRAVSLPFPGSWHL